MSNMTSLERVLTTLGHKEPDRVPLFLLLTMHGAKELGMTIQEYFSRGEYVAEGQLRLRAKYGHDCLYPFFYAPVEVEAWGAEVIYHKNGPPNSGTPFIQNHNQILKLQKPNIKGNDCLEKVLKSIQILKKSVKDEAPIVGVVMSPFSLPVMQMGFDRYLELMYEQPKLFEHLMRVNEEFIVSWANAQLEAGATAITYFDPVSSTDIVPRELFLKTGFEIAKRTIARIKGPTAVHLASGRCLPVVNDIANLGTAIIGTSVLEDIGLVKSACKGKLTVLGNLNGVEMCRWTKVDAEIAVKEAISKAAPGGGFILSDNHGEIPFLVEDEILMTIAETVRRYGRYPIKK
ncbi:uroporphyrinogen decarboxylase family protein [Candidatus Venteria ishoeyi]|uniref:Uroporphyrinogen decarboxylase n=1 Tax=Candidatus Venteria ishoeyi TaxID=1899563 RepID=A0A1H6F5A7_9GAMM|nr:uroporphyrinogen decarboxylase family protein [Candidatus Venteria ishoeyi]SEH05357.1 Uroporphyrinogen decarboxylase [Candidatus Venteria ishoeyi]